jgi:ribosomal protein S18 acetylase RimI-like enzyme
LLLVLLNLRGEHRVVKWAGVQVRTCRSTHVMPRGSEEILLRNLETHDLLAVAAVHVAAFPHSALTGLGREAVRRYYEWQLCGPHDVVALGAFSGTELVGFCFGGVFRGATSGFVRANPAFLARRVLTRPRFITNALFRDRLLTGMRILKRAWRSQDPPRSHSARFGILSIAVDPSHRRSGVGRIIMRDMEERARDRGFNRMHLSVEPHNLTAIRFYERLGWKTVGHDPNIHRMTKHL